jgi:1-acyl-sn-glycerol-3-phosphate acyltransferase
MILFKYFSITRHIFYGFYVGIVRLRSANLVQREAIIQQWSLQLLKILEVTLEIRGELPTYDRGVLYVSNHISWLDIHVINAWRPMRFVAKKEVGEWPVFGWFAKQLNTLFIDRQARGDSFNISFQMAKGLNQQDRICIFPEGTSSDGEFVLPFKPNLFQSAIASNAPCQPISIWYESILTGQISKGPAFIGDMGLIESIANTVKAKPLKVIIHVTPICQIIDDRKALSLEAWNNINTSRLRIN